MTVNLESRRQRRCTVGGEARGPLLQVKELFPTSKLIHHSKRSISGDVQLSMVGFGASLVGKIFARITPGGSSTQIW